MAGALHSYSTRVPGWASACEAAGHAAALAREFTTAHAEHAARAGSAESASGSADAASAVAWSERLEAAISGLLLWAQAAAGPPPPASAAAGEGAAADGDVAPDAATLGTEMAALERRLGCERLSSVLVGVVGLLSQLSEAVDTRPDAGGVFAYALS